MTKYLPFVYDETGLFVNDKGFILIGNNLKYITSCLNSKVIHYWLRMVFPELQGGTRELRKVFFVNTPIVKPPNYFPFEAIVDYILFLKENNSVIESELEVMILFFEDLIDAMIFEIYFKESMYKQGKEILKYLNNLPDIQNLPKEEKLITIKETYEKLSHHNHPIAANMYYLDSVPEVRIVLGK